MKAPLFDQMWSASGFDAYSPAAQKLISDFGVECETVPATICGSAGRTISTEYVFIQFLTCLNAVDWECSEVDAAISATGEPYVGDARRLVLRQEVVDLNVPVFRLDERPTALLVSQAFRDEWERRGLTGARFRSLDPFMK
jgi:DNA mismatch repair protein MutH